MVNNNQRIFCFLISKYSVTLNCHYWQSLSLNAVNVNCKHDRIDIKELTLSYSNCIINSGKHYQFEYKHK